MLWTLRKADNGEEFRNRTLEELCTWAHSAQVNPLDELSQDGVKWIRAQEVPEFEMVWKVMLADGEDYGPTNIGTLKEFLKVNLLRPDSLARHIDGVTVSKIKHLVTGKKTHEAAKKTDRLSQEHIPQAASTKSEKPSEPSTPVAGLSVNQALAWKAKIPPPKIRDYHTQPLPVPAFLRVPPPSGTIFPADVDYPPQNYPTD